MVVVMQKGAAPEQRERVLAEIKALGFTPHVSDGESRSLIGAIGPAPTEEVREHLRALPGVETVVRITKPFKLASREFRHDDSAVHIGGVATGQGRFVVAAGPCGVESREQLQAAAAIAQRHGAHVLRGGAFKPRTSPYSFQGLGEEGLALLAEARAATGMPIVTEVTAPELVETVAATADMLQIGARNSQNFALLAEAGKSGKPVLFKRGLSTSISEFLQAAEYVLSQGNPNVVLCERGIRTFETSTRFTLDISAVPVLKELTHLPVWVDPSHAAGRRPLVPALALAAAAAGADGIIVEVHAKPEEAKSDAAQQLDDGEFAALMAQLRGVVAAVGKAL
ncbi:MAG: 3-deoxy-7-phosphoheptulonate synthase [Trueperaceae bacterium]|nr:3-deoxy-7-phosphoheptulonate synthase [Trueperaceae bacterium]